jgi:choline dehydrogenase-like flavoprotein
VPLHHFLSLQRPLFAPEPAGADTILGELAAPENHEIELWSDTLCRSLLLIGTQITGAMVEHLPSGTHIEILARIVVVAADALRTPQLLWASGIRPAALGHSLNDQPQVICALRMPADKSHPGYMARQGTRAPFGAFWVPYSDAGHPFHGQVMHVGTSPLPLAATEQEDADASFVILGWFCAKDIRFIDRVEFSEAHRDYLGMPAPLIHYGLSEEDHRRIEQAVSLVRQAAHALGTLVPGYEPRMIPEGSSLHYQGSTRMGDTPEDSVCDTYSRVWSYEGLYVGGNGVIPTAMACNPTLTSCALAVRAAEQIAAVLNT